MENVRIDAFCFLWAAVALMVLPLRWLAAALAAAVFHEVCHYLAIRLTGGQVHGLMITVSGARMETTQLSPGQELIASLAGPLGGLALLSLAQWMPLTALCGLIHSLYNLIPVYPLDGGRALYCAIRMLTDETRADHARKYLSTLTMILLTVICLFAALRLKLGLLPLILIIPIFKEFRQEKYLAKQTARGYNKGYHI